MKQDGSKTEKWVVVAPYFTGGANTWLDDFIHDDRFTFEKVAPRKKTKGWHFDRTRTTGAKRWMGYVSQIRLAFIHRPDGIITSFPQLAILAGLFKRLRRSPCRIIAYNFNLGALPGGVRQQLARYAAAAVDCFVVHSPTEVASYAAYLGVPEARVVFVPLQRGDTDIVRNEETEEPFILSLGSAHRDYPTLIAAVDALEIPTVIVTRPADIDSLPKSAWVTYKTHLTQAECHHLLARARLSVTPVSNMTTASGQITFIDSLRLGVPTIATRCPGSDGYITHGKTGLLVAPFDKDDLQARIADLWENAPLRATLSKAGMQDAKARFTDQAAAEQLHRLMCDRVG